MRLNVEFKVDILDRVLCLVVTAKICDKTSCISMFFCSVTVVVNYIHCQREEWQNIFLYQNKEGVKILRTGCIPPSRWLKNWRVSPMQGAVSEQVALGSNNEYGLWTVKQITRNKIVSSIMSFNGIKHLLDLRWKVNDAFECNSYFLCTHVGSTLLREFMSLDVCETSLWNKTHSYIHVYIHKYL